MSNIDIREALDKKDVRQWEVAEEMGVSEFTFSRRMRRDVSPEYKEQILSAIRKIAEKKGKH